MGNVFGHLKENILLTIGKPFLSYNEAFYLNGIVLRETPQGRVIDEEQTSYLRIMITIPLPQPV